MLFGLTNAPATFPHFMNDVLREYLDIFCSAYLDDILIYSNMLGEHRVHVKMVLGAIKKAGLFLRPEKCEFHVQTTSYLGIILSPGKLSMDPKKVDAVRDWETPSYVKDEQSFLGFANFYWRLILGFSRVVSPLTTLTKKGVSFAWSTEAEEAFQKLNLAFTSVPVLGLFNTDRPSVVETDASAYVSAGVRSQ